MPMPQFEPVLSLLVENAPVAVALILTVVLFLRRQREQAVEARETLSQILDSSAASQKEMAIQVAAIAHEINRVAERMDRLEDCARKDSK